MGFVLDLKLRVADSKSLNLKGFGPSLITDKYASSQVGNKN